MASFEIDRADRRFHSRVAADSFGVVRSEALTDARSPVVCDEVEPLEADRVEEGEQLGGHLLHGVAGRGLVGLAVALEVDGEHPARAGEVDHLEVPGEPGLGEPVEEHDRLADRGSRVDPVPPESGRVQEVMSKLDAGEGLGGVDGRRRRSGGAAAASCDEERDRQKRRAHPSCVPSVGVVAPLHGSKS